MSSSITKECIDNPFSFLMETPIELRPYVTRWIDKIDLLFLHLATFRNDPFNSVKSSLKFQLSKHGRLALSRGIDLIDAMEVDLMCGEEVESATLSMCISVPADPVERQKHLDDGTLLQSDKTVGGCVNIWMPIKTLKNPERQFKFFDKPFNPSFSYPTLSIEIKMKTERIEVRNRNIILDVYMLTSDTRRSVPKGDQCAETFALCTPVVNEFVLSYFKSAPTTDMIYTFWKTPQPFASDLFSLFKYYMTDVKKHDSKGLNLFSVSIPRKAELSEINQFDMDMYHLGFRKTQSYTLHLSSKPFEYEIWGREKTTDVCFTLDSNPFNKLDSTKLDSTKLDSSKFDSSKFDSSKFDSSKFDSHPFNKVDSTKVDSTKVDSNPFNKVDSTKLDSTKLDSTVDSSSFKVYLDPSKTSEKTECSSLQRLIYNIQPLDLNSFLPNFNLLPNIFHTKEYGSHFLIIGNRGTGKSTLIKSILRAKANIFTKGVFVNPVNVEFYKDVIANTTCYGNLTNILLNDLITEQKHISENQRTVVVLDDCDINTLKSDFSKFFTESYGYKMNVFVSLQYARFFDPCLKRAVDGIFIFPGTEVKLLRSYWDQYIRCFIPEFVDFLIIMRSLPCYTALFIDTTIYSTYWRDTVFKYTATL